jgi:prenyltransferase beta subunit
VLSADRSLVENVYPLQSEEIREKVLASKLKDIELLQKFFREAFTEIIAKIKKNTAVYLSEIHCILLGLRLQKVEITAEEKNLLFEYLVKAIDPNGGFFPTIISKDWQRRPRIYSTFYALAAIKLLGMDNDFFRLQKEWSQRTLSWLLSAQRTSGENEGAFLEEDCPLSIAPENAFWALWCLSYFQKNGLVENIDNVVSKACRWVRNYFLRNFEFWSSTRLFFALNTLRMWCRNEALTEDSSREIVRFIDSLKSFEGYSEFPTSVKKGYREDVGHAHISLHSTLFARLSLKILNAKEFKLKDAITILDNFRGKEGFGTQLKIKEYEYGPSSTLFENFLAFVACLSVLPED